jgi:NAD(P)H dehydrogenase (quinone)
MTRAGVPEMVIGMISGFSQAIAQGEFDFSNNDLEKILGRKPISLSSFLSEVYKLSE